jgi:hypothetical protein
MDTKHYYCSVEHTKQFGIIKAALIGRILFWCDYNKKNKIKDRYYDGYWWSGYMTADEFSEQTGIVKKTIRTNLKQLIDMKILIIGNYNKFKMDKTRWYRVDESFLNRNLEVTKKGTTKLPNRELGSDQIGNLEVTKKGTPIPVSHSVNQNVNQTVGQSVNTPVNTSVDKELLKAIKEKIDYQLIDVLVELVSNNQLTSNQRNLILDNKFKLIKKIPILEEYITKIEY